MCFFEIGWQNLLLGFASFFYYLKSQTNFYVAKKFTQNFGVRAKVSYFIHEVKKMKVKYDNPVRTNVTKEVKEEIDKYCKEKGVRLSDFLRDAIEFYLKNN